MNASEQSVYQPFNQQELQMVSGEILLKSGATLPEDAKAFIQTVYRQTGQRLYLPEQIDALTPQDLQGEETAQLKAALKWVRDFLMRPHPNLGRPGVVCPYVDSGIKNHVIYFTVARPEDPNHYESVENTMKAYATIFEQIPPQAGPLADLRVLMVLFPESNVDVLKDAKHSMRLKTDLLQKGLMLGQFFPELDPVKFLKSKFFPVQVPLSLYSVRGMLEVDWMFIHQEAEWRKIYKARYGEPRPNMPVLV